jgi:hypothetical protein
MKMKLAAMSVLLGAICFTHHASAERMPQDNWYYVKTIGTNGPTSDQINGAMGLALDKSNRLFVADSGNNRIQVFDRDGNFLFRWGSNGSGNGQFNYPRAICVTTNDLVLSCNDKRYRVSFGAWQEMRPESVVVRKTCKHWNVLRLVGPNLSEWLNEPRLSWAVWLASE